MMVASLGDFDRLTQEAGILATWVDAGGRPQRVSPDTLQALLHGLGLHAETQTHIRDSIHILQGEHAAQTLTFRAVLAGEAVTLGSDQSGSYVLEAEDGSCQTGTLAPATGAKPVLIAPETPGYYRLRVINGTDMTLAVAPRVPAPFGPLSDATRHWGLSAQVYSLRREHAEATACSFGHGDFGAVCELAAHAATAGADVLSLSPVHAMFSADTTLCSPYSPSNRLLLNVLYADPVVVLGEDFVRAAWAEQPIEHWMALERRRLIDWSASGQARLTGLRALHARFLTHAPINLSRQYTAFLKQATPMLERHALFEAMHAVASAQRGTPTPWPDWDPDWRTPDSAASAEFSQSHADDIDFHRFAQWLAHTSLACAQARAKEGGMRVGLLADLAVGSSPLGSQAWSRPDDYVQHASVGAPADAFNAAGQAWGLLAASPRTMRTGRYASFIELLRANLAYTGGMRIDHVLGFSRLWLVPDGAAPTEGAYLRYPAQTLFRLASLEAWRHRALLIGENLGMVPPDFNPMLRAHGMAGMSVLWFMRGAGRDDHAEQPFLSPHQWPADSVSMATTHDLPTLCGWWTARDIHWRQRAHAEANIPAQQAERQRSRRALWQALEPHATDTPPTQPPLDRMLQYVAESDSALTLVATEDLEGLSEQANLPFFPAHHANWRRRLPRAAAALFDDPIVKTRLDAIRKGRNRS